MLSILDDDIYDDGRTSFEELLAEGEYKSVKLKIGSNPNVYIDTASRTYIIDYDFGDEPYGVDINRTCDTLDALLERNFTPYHRH